MKLVSVVGARPNFMKIAPIIRAIEKHNLNHSSPVIHNHLVHTGQHYDYEMSRVFFEDLELPAPDIYLGVGSGTHAEQTGKIMIEFEKVLLTEKPDLLVVVGDVNSTLAAALTAAKLHIPVAHIEAGLRSFDHSMPEEINRLLTDQIADYLFTHSKDADDNLAKEGISPHKVYFVGNVMIDSLLYNKRKASTRNISKNTRLADKEYCVLTLHRPFNVDNENSLTSIISVLKEFSRDIDIIFPCHPRTRKMINQCGLTHYFNYSRDTYQKDGDRESTIHLLPPLGYLDFLGLEMNSRFVITDSGGIQEETTFLNIPCLTLRNSTERPVTVREGSNTLVGKDCRKLQVEVAKILSDHGKSGRIPDLWDGQAAERIISVMAGKKI
jgi:UDP-N-acetylglucosamine 2-epimerase (non-hydrolysing)